MSITPFEIEVGATGHGRVIVNDVDISDQATGFSLVSRPREVTKLTVEMVGEGPIEGLGDVTIVLGASALANFLKAVDPEELERVALERVAFGDSLTRAMLDVLAEWADPS